jgi:cytochrome c556
MNKKLLSAGLALVLGAGYALTAYSQVKPEQLVKQRQSAMTLIAKYFGPLGGMLKGAVPYNADVVARNAAYLDVLSQMPWDGFAESTKGVKSAALPVAFTDGAKFKQAQDQLRTAVGALNTAAKGGNEAAVKAAIGDVGKACGACHDNFREKQ